MSRNVSLAELADLIEGRVLGDPAHLVEGVCTLRSPVPRCLAFAKSVEGLNKDRLRDIGVALLIPQTVEAFDLPAIAVANPRYAFAQVVARYFVPQKRRTIAKSALIDESVVIGGDVAIGEYCVIGPNCEIGQGTELRHHVVLGEGVKIGRNCLIKSHAVIGEEGFGFEQAPDGTFLRIPHLGAVVIGDQVEVGATTVIAQGTIDCTTIGDRTKIDDHVFIAHNCRIAEDVMIIAHAEISGSCEVGARAWIGPNAAILNGVSIAEDSLVGMGAVVIKPTEAAGVYAGSPARLLKYKSD